jgi:CelD/BcsL family acetyltransferase involved in cellulose biosynthesis
MLTVWHDGQLVGAASLCRDGGTLRFLAVDELDADYADLLVLPGFEDAVVDTVASALLESSSWTQLKLEGFAAGALVERLAQRLAIFASYERVTCGVCPVLEVLGSWEQLLKRRFDRKRRYNVQREMRLATERHGLAARTVNTMDGVPDAIETLFRLHRARMALLQIDSRFADDRNAAFHRRVAARFQAAGWLALDVIEQHGIPVAALYGFRFGGRFWLYQTGLDQVGAAAGAGTFAVASRISESANDGTREFDFLRGDEAYKALWADRQIALWTLHLFRNGIRGWLTHKLWGVRRTLSRAARRVCGR